jgi:hypothetical protein
MPLFEKPEWPRHVTKTEEIPCGLHPHNLSIGFCRRCRTAICGICRTRWFDQPLCTACADRAIQLEEKHPDEIRLQSRQTRWALIFALAGWVLFLLGVGLLFFLRQDGPRPGWFYLAKFSLLACLLPSFFGIGNGLAALRLPGPGFKQALTGFILGSSLVGLLVGILIYNTWQN